MGILQAVRSMFADKAERPSPDVTSPFLIEHEPVDRLKNRLTGLRRSIESCKREIIEIERKRDVQIGQLRADIASAHQAASIAEQRLRGQIQFETEDAAKRIATLHQLIRSSEAGLSPLEPNAAAIEAPMESRMVPRPEVPVMVHAAIRS